jgi:hypothetical protein
VGGETQTKDAAAGLGLSVSEYESLVAETNAEPRRQLAEFRAEIGERLASLNAVDHVDGEATIDRLIAELSVR